MNKQIVYSFCLASLVHLGVIFINFSNISGSMSLPMQQADYSMELSLVSPPTVVFSEASQEDIMEKEIESVDEAETILFPDKVKPKEAKKLKEKGRSQKQKLQASVNSLQGVATDAVCLNNVPPKYPLLARNLGYSGKVNLSIVVKVDGTVESVDIVHSSGHKILDKCALKAAYKWQFSPAMENNVTIESTVMIPVVFRLEE